jgi:methionyl-tRNA formyltransferase
MKMLLMADSLVGSSIAQWILYNYPDDLAALVTISECDFVVATREKGIPCFVFESELQIKKELSYIAPFDIGILAWWPKIISSSLISFARVGFINTHPSLLPFNRGKHYNFWALVEQAPFGVSLHFVDEGIDSGDIIAQMPIAYDWVDTGGTLYQKAGKAMIDLFKSTYPNIRNANIPRTPQNLRDGSIHFANEIDQASKIHLDQSYTARELFNRLRARTFAGKPACTFEDNNEIYEITVNIKKRFK